MVTLLTGSLRCREGPGPSAKSEQPGPSVKWEPQEPSAEWEPQEPRRCRGPMRRRRGGRGGRFEGAGALLKP